MFDKKIEKIIPIGDDLLEFYFYDGIIIKQEWHSHARTRCWDNVRRKEWGVQIKKRWEDGKYVKECKNDTCNC